MGKSRPLPGAVKLRPAGYRQRPAAELESHRLATRRLSETYTVEYTRLRPEPVRRPTDVKSPIVRTFGNLAFCTGSKMPYPPVIPSATMSDAFPDVFPTARTDARPAISPDATRDGTRAACHRPGRPTDARARQLALSVARSPPAPLSGLAALVAVLLPAAAGSQPGTPLDIEPDSAPSAGVSARPSIPVPVAAAFDSATRRPGDWGTHPPRGPEHPPEVKARASKLPGGNHLPFLGDSVRTEMQIL